MYDCMLSNTHWLNNTTGMNYLNYPLTCPTNKKLLSIKCGGQYPLFVILLPNTVCKQCIELFAVHTFCTVLLEKGTGFAAVPPGG